MAKPGSNKPQILQARVIELSAQGASGRRIAAELRIHRSTVARILAGPEAQGIALEARERARRMVEKADEALHRSLDRGSARIAIAVLKGAGVFESRAESIVRYRYQDMARVQADLEELERKSRELAAGKFGRAPGLGNERESARIERLAWAERERAANPQPKESPPFDPYAFAVRSRLRRHR